MELECPDCGGEMRLKNGRGSSVFYSCRDFPDCKGMRTSDGNPVGHRHATRVADEDDADDRLPSERMRAASRSRWRDE